MSENTRPIISDPYTEIPGTTMEERLKKYHADTLEYSRIREEELLNAPSIIDNFMDCIDKIRNIFSRQKTK